MMKNNDKCKIGKKSKNSSRMWLMIPAAIAIAAVILFIFYGTRSVDALDNFSVLYGSASDESVEYLKSECKTHLNTSLFKYNAVTSKLMNNVIILTNDLSTIPNVDKAKQGISEGDYIIYRLDNNLYIYAADDDTMKCAINYFVNECVDEAGNLSVKAGETVYSSGLKRYEELFIGEAPISVFGIYYEKKAIADSAELLQYYIAQCSGSVNEIKKGRMSDEEQVPGMGKSAGIELSLSSAMTPGTYNIVENSNNVVITAYDVEAMNEAVCMFANRYLGWYYAGTEKEHFARTVGSMHIEIAEETECWIEEREPIITLWNENYPRGFYLSTDVSLEADVMSFSDDQLYDYVRMMQYCGYTGIQVTDICSAWAGAGGYEAVQDKIRVMFEAAHCLGMNTTLWVWGAEFDGYGWTDSNVTITHDDTDVRYDEEAYAVFDKYYNIYAELADCTDRLIAHFYDPGNLSDSEDIAFYSKLLWSKFSAVNPNVNFGINCWGDKFSKPVLVRELGNGFTIYEGTDRNEESGYEEFRGFVSERGNSLGTWSWNNCEMEIDQLAQMNYNIEMIKSTYQIAKGYDYVCKPEYWSEMDSNHLVNIFSHYAAAQLLQNPDLDTNELTLKIARDAVGPEYESEFAEILQLIQKARTGENWESFFWSMDDYILLSKDYPAEEILADSEKAIAAIDEMISAGVESYAIPLPIAMSDLLLLVRPNIQQIHDYAQFRIEFAKLEKLCAENAEILSFETANAEDDATDANVNGNTEGIDADAEDAYAEAAAQRAEFIAEIEAQLKIIAEPIKDYNCVIGSWGQVEARVQQLLVVELCEKYGIERPHYAQYDTVWKYRIRSQMASYQRGVKEPVYFAAPYYQYGYALGDEETERLVTEMVEAGTLIRNSDGRVYLSDWDNYSYMSTY